ncbi:hypothetical protein [Leptospira noguchii]|uniref:AAA domain protein n=1 Tax=Leptospira noguchii serovar Autumnalis str. ZUN142 TaxID=1085540 RepID=M6U7F5_9LEPT|nr:hypothetical protein [Leptospira noguchii]EMO30454.1 hypothetical protein LEP1GSC170_2880 [Leptospira interrogans serovar Bataviae str. HAI135]EKR72128.1 hypothetical protein LEP1GSC041_0979 [Leptospira noguchii str. 2006001870]EMO40947.1 hypothetical protein LEP1GSC186_4374 [Leptospira noguchii serovar Autumnalis str. ZUN142]EMS85583.1 hypothetical protein LEP1GSC074_4314 [Leptospira noguchii str. Hook]UOG34168.1 hypothetical protein MAL02_16880 [Leptospira noguchii]
MKLKYSKLIMVGPTNSGKTTTSYKYNSEKSRIFHFDREYKNRLSTKLAGRKEFRTIHQSVLDKIIKNESDLCVYEGSHLILPDLFNTIIGTIKSENLAFILFDFPFFDLCIRMKNRSSYQNTKFEKFILLLVSYILFSLNKNILTKKLKEKNIKYIEIKNSNLLPEEVVRLINYQLSIYNV